jgi:hypothetical protein
MCAPPCTFRLHTRAASHGHSLNGARKVGGSTLRPSRHIRVHAHLAYCNSPVRASWPALRPHSRVRGRFFCRSRLAAMSTILGRTYFQGSATLASLIEVGGNMSAARAQEWLAAPQNCACSRAAASTHPPSHLHRHASLPLAAVAVCRRTSRPPRPRPGFQPPLGPPAMTSPRSRRCWRPACRCASGGRASVAVTVSVAQQLRVLLRPVPAGCVCSAVTSTRGIGCSSTGACGLM